MASINKYNYEEYMIDFMEGNLSPTLVKEMEIFLELHPDIKEEIEGLDEVVLSQEELSFFDKESLYRNVDASIFEGKCISYIENEYKEIEKKKFEIEASLDSGKQSLLEDYKKTILVADRSIKFNNKESLKRYFPFRFKKLIHFSSAAAIIFAISLSILLLPSEFVDTNQLSENNKVFDMPKENIPQEIITNPKKAFTKEIKIIKVDKPMLKKKNIISPKPTVKKLDIKRIPIQIASKKISNTTIVNDIQIANNNVVDEIIIHERLTVSDEVIKEMSNELALNSNAREWKTHEEDNVKNKKVSSNNIFNDGQKKIKTILGKLFYKKEIRHAKEDNSTDK